MMHVEDLMRQMTRLLKQPTLYELVLHQGERMELAQLTRMEARYAVELIRTCGGFRRFQPRMCFMNAQRLAVRNLEFRRNPSVAVHYCEGYIAFEDHCICPIAHAWLTINGKVLDVTLRAMSKTTRHTYYGMKIPVRMVLKHHDRAQEYSPVIEGPLQNKLFTRKVIEQVCKSR